MLEKLDGQSNTNILVYGWYHQGNLGDDLFVDAFRQLFPAINFTFTNHITSTYLKDVDAVFIGGGSFLGETPNITADALALLEQMKLLYIGVGAETQIHPTHIQLMSKAKLIATRTSARLDKVLEINTNTIVIPDIVYSLTPTLGQRKEKSILILPNIVVVPRWNDPHWKHASWEYFKNEFAQTLDELLEQGFDINFLPLCVNASQDDGAAALEIMNRMERRNRNRLLEKRNNLRDVTELMSQYSLIVTQRYHGGILAHMSQTPYLTVHHHDKLKNSSGFTLSYYELSKSKLLEQINLAMASKNAGVLPIDRNIFDDLKRVVNNIL